MICRKCNKDNQEGSLFCCHCGASMKEQPELSKAVVEPEAEVKSAKKKLDIRVICVAIAAFFAVAAATCFALLYLVKPEETVKPDADKRQEAKADMSEEEVSEEKEVDEASTDKEKMVVDVETLERPMIVDSTKIYYDETLVPSMEDYTVSPDLKEIYNQEDIAYIPDDMKDKLTRNLFVVDKGSFHEFYEVYESNTYCQTPNYVTVDSLMHTYHVYFSYLLKNTEKKYLTDLLATLSGEMFEASLEQYEELKSSEWEVAAGRNVAYFAVACNLLGESPSVPSELKGDVKTELDYVMNAGGIDTSPLFGTIEDYSQYKPRGYYDGDATLEKYFRTMMWYGRMSFEQKNEDHVRSSVLMNIALSDTSVSEWERIYTVTSFFAGVSDDVTYYEYLPLIEDAYGELPDAAMLVEDTAAFDKLTKLTANFEPPRINSIPVYEGEENVITSYRFMGQRFSIDATIFTQLTYRNVLENSKGETRMLPDVLDVPAALGSATAYEILDEQGATSFKNYDENLDEIRSYINQDDSDMWNASLYGQWLNTLRPVLDEKGKGYPSFMQGGEWNKRALECFAGSYTELKHDTVLYSKQSMAEMGGGDLEPVDDRGFVETEPVVYSRFIVLAESTAEGLNSYGILDKNDEANLMKLAELARKLLVISEKELTNEVLTDEEYKLIRDYGGNIEHFWMEAMRSETGEDYVRYDEHPASLVVDIATDPNGSVLECANAQVSEMYVIVPVAGKLKVCTGPVYNFYQFEQPIDQRLTDEEWRYMTGEWYEFDENYNYVDKSDKNLKKPEWTESYHARRYEEW